MNAFDRINKVIDFLKSKKTQDLYKTKENAFIRKSKLMFLDLCLLFLFKKGLTNSMELNNYFFLNKLEEAASKQAFSTKRQLLNPDVFIEANNEYVKSVYKRDDIKLFKNKYLVLAIDGVVGEIPNTAKLREIFGDDGRKDQTNVARTRNSALYDCLNHVMVSFNINGYKSAERELAKDNIIEGRKILGDSFPFLIIQDRGYPSIEMFGFHEKMGNKYIIRLQDNTYNAEINSMKSNDEILELKINHNRLLGVKDPKEKKRLLNKGSIKVRVVKVVLDNGEIELLATNLTKEEISVSELKEMYFKRWGIETAYEILKNKLHIENVSGKSEIAVRQDYYATFLAFNMMEDIKNDANKGVTRNIDNGNQYDYKVNTNILVGSMKLCLIAILLEEDPLKAEKLQKNMMKMVQRELVAIVPDRSYPRKPYTGKNKHRLNMRRNS